jgi:hypothetical protein
MSQVLQRSPVELVPNIEEAALEYMRLKAQAAELDAAMKRLRNVIEVAIAEEPEKRAVIAGFRFALVTVERDNFNLKKALEKLDGRVLRPYITTSRYTMLKVSE